MRRLAAGRFANRVLATPPSYAVFALLLIVLWVSRPQMLNPAILGIFVRQIVPLGILVLGQLLVMRVKSIDLSSGGVVLLVNYFISSGTFPNATVAEFVALAILTGILIGAATGYLIAVRRSSAVIVTLAFSTIIVGLVQYLSSGKPPGDVPSVFADMYNTKVEWFPTPVLLWLACAFALWAFLSKTVFGKFVASVGENPVAAHFSGVPVQRTVFMCHVLSGFMASVAALVQTASIAVGSVRVGLDLPILSVAATILGGVAFGKGDGGVWGPFFGALSFALLFVVMTTFGIDEPGKLITQGLIIVIAAIFYGLRATKG